MHTNSTTPIEGKPILRKCRGTPALYSKVAVKYATLLDENGWVAKYRCHVPIRAPDYILRDTRFEGREFFSDFLVFYWDGHVGIRECVEKKSLGNRRVQGHLRMSKRYWQRLGVQDWQLVIGQEEGHRNE